MQHISEHELDSMPLATLVRRMDEFLIQTYLERYGIPPSKISLPNEVFTSLTVKQRADIEIRRIVYIAFSYLIQLEFNSVSSGFANRILYTETYKPSDWTSPAFRLRDASIKQYQIISSRIAFEIFIDLLYVIETGERIQSKKSKLKAFRTWLCDTNNKFHYFAHVLLEAYRFDREIRTPEVHGASPLPRKMLLLQEPSSQEMNQQHQLSNILINVWEPLIDILNDVRPNYMQVLSNDEWFKVFLSGNNEAIETKLDNMFHNLPL